MDTVAAGTTDLRTDALTIPVKRPDARAALRELGTRHRSVTFPLVPLRLVITDIGWICSLGGGLGMLAFFGEALAERGPDWITTVLVTGAFASLLLVIGVAQLRLSVRLRPRLDTAKRHYRLARFASDNGMTYDPTPQGPGDLKPLRGRGSLTLTRVMRPLDHRSIVQFANYEVVIGQGRSRLARFGGLCAIRLPSPLPHIVLEARSGGRSLASAAPVRGQVLSLEGNFDDNFTLYCPEGYEQDALYLFTPDVMAQLIDHVRGFDVEILDDWLFLESTRDLVTLDPAIWHHVLAATTAITEKIDRWGRWRDTRVEDAPLSSITTRVPQVAPAGRRLRMLGGPVGLIAGIFGALLAGAILYAISI